MSKTQPRDHAGQSAEQDPGAVPGDGTVPFDLAVIVEYLDSLAGGGRLLAPAGRLRWLVLTSSGACRRPA